MLEIKHEPGDSPKWLCKESQTNIWLTFGYQTELVQPQPATISRKHQQIITKTNTPTTTNQTKLITKTITNNKTSTRFIR